MVYMRQFDKALSTMLSSVGYDYGCDCGYNAKLEGLILAFSTLIFFPLFGCFSIF